MGNPTAFLHIPRQEAGYRPVNDRVHDYGEVEQTLNYSDRRTQASRCMDCGVPFCHWACPIGNKQPEWQDMLYKGRWQDAYNVLEQTCDFPEFTGRVCPALCEKSCVLSLSIHEPVTIRENEVSIAEMAFREGFVAPKSLARNNKKVAVIGSGPAGLTVANRLNRKGFHVTVFEKDERAGGLLRYGIPNFKLGKSIVDRRISLMESEGVKFKTKTKVGETISATEILNSFDAVCIAIGCETPRDLNVEGRELRGIHFAMELLAQQNRVLQSIAIPKKDLITAKDKHVLVIGGGDTGSDCVGTSNRHGAASVTQIEILPKPPADFNPETPWPLYPQILKTSSSHEEGCTRRWNLTTNKFVGDKGAVKGVEVEEVEWTTPKNGGRPTMQATGKKEILRADLVLLSMGFIHPVYEGLLAELGVAMTDRQTVATDGDCRTSLPKVFACGDAATGASLVVRAMASGQATANAIEKYLS